MKQKLILISFISVLPVLAQDGFQVGVNTGFMKTSIDDPMKVAQTNTSPFDVKYATAEYGDPKPLGLAFSYRKGNNEFSFDYFGFDTEESRTLATADGWSTYRGFPVVDVETSLKAKIIDLKWIHYFPMDQAGTFSTTMGARFGSFKHNIQHSFVPAPGASSKIDFESKSKGIGLLIGAGYSYPINERFSVGANANFAFLRGDDEGSFVMRDFGTVYTRETSPKSQTRTFTQSDVNIHMDVKIVKGLVASVGYRYLDFGKAGSSMNAHSPDEMVSGAIGGSPSANLFHSSTGWKTSGFTVGVAYLF